MILSGDSASTGSRAQISAATQTSISGGSGVLVMDSTGSTFTGGVVLGTPTGGALGTGTINVAGGVYLNGVAYTNPEPLLAELSARITALEAEIVRLKHGGQ